MGRAEPLGPEESKPSKLIEPTGPVLSNGWMQARPLLFQEPFQIRPKCLKTGPTLSLCVCVCVICVCVCEKTVSPPLLLTIYSIKPCFLFSFSSSSSFADPGLLTSAWTFSDPSGGVESNPSFYPSSVKHSVFTSSRCGLFLSLFLLLR